MQDQQQQQDDGQWERPEHPTMETVQGPGHRRRIVAAVAGAVAVAGIVGVAVWAGTGGSDDTAAEGTRGGVPVTWHPTAAETPPPGVGTVEPAEPVDTAASGNPWQARADGQAQMWDDVSRDAIDAQNERVFLDVVRGEGVRFPSDEAAVRYGREICADVDRTGSVTVTALARFADPAPLSADDAAFMVGASIAAFCPEHEASLWEFVDSTR